MSSKKVSVHPDIKMGHPSIMECIHFKAVPFSYFLSSNFENFTLIDEIYFIQDDIYILDIHIKHKVNFSTKRVGRYHASLQLEHPTFSNQHYLI